MEFQSVNYLAVVIASLAAFIFGSLWYGPLLGKTWLKEMGFTKENMEKPNMPKVFGLSFLMMLVAVFGLAFLLSGHGTQEDVNMSMGVWHGLFLGIFIVIPVFGVNYLYQRKSFKLFLIDIFYWIIWLSIAGMILGAMH